MEICLGCFGIIGLIYAFKVLNYLTKRSTNARRVKALKILDVDRLDGYSFEHYVATVMGSRGYRVTVTPPSNDYGVDLIAEKNGQKIAVQAKRYSDSKVSRSAVSDAVAGMKFYQCNCAMVITNSYFTPDAKKMAKGTGCILVDRDILVRWIYDFQSGKRKLPHELHRPEPEIQNSKNESSQNTSRLKSHDTEEADLNKKPLLQIQNAQVFSKEERKANANENLQNSPLPAKNSTETGNISHKVIESLKIGQSIRFANRREKNMAKDILREIGFVGNYSDDAHYTDWSKGNIKIRINHASLTLTRLS